MQSMATMVGRRESFASILAKLWDGEEEESDAAAVSEQKKEKKDFCRVDWKAKSKAKKEKISKKIEKNIMERMREDTAIEQYGDLSKNYLNLASLFEMDRSLQVSRAVALLYSCQLDECIFECEYLLACEVPGKQVFTLQASPEGAAHVFESLEELKCFDVALKVILAQALAFYGDVPSLARASIIYNLLAVDNRLRSVPSATGAAALYVYIDVDTEIQICRYRDIDIDTHTHTHTHRKQCEISFSAMQRLMEDFDAAKADCLRSLTAATAQFPTVYTQYVTAAVVQKQQKSEFKKEALEFIHRLSQASNEFNKSSDVVQSHRQHYCKAHAEVQKLDAKQWNAVGD